MHDDSSSPQPMVRIIGRIVDDGVVELTMPWPQPRPVPAPAEAEGDGQPQS